MSHSHQSIARALKRLPIDLETLPEIDMSNPNVDHELKSGPRRFNGKPPTGFGDLSPLSPYSAREFSALDRRTQQIALSFRHCNATTQGVDADLSATAHTFSEHDALVLLAAVRRVLAERGEQAGYDLTPQSQGALDALDDAIGDLSGALEREREGRAR